MRSCCIIFILFFTEISTILPRLWDGCSVQWVFCLATPAQAANHQMLQTDICILLEKSDVPIYILLQKQDINYGKTSCGVSTSGMLKNIKFCIKGSCLMESLIFYLFCFPFRQRNIFKLDLYDNWIHSEKV